MISQCVGQNACLAADINFDTAGLWKGILQLTVDGLSWGAIYALVAVGYTLVYGVLKLINFAHSEVFMFGMFGAYFCLDMILGFRPMGDTYDKGIVLTVFYLGIAMIFAMLVSGATALGLEAVAYRPLRRRNAGRLSFLITAIGMSFVLQEFVHFILPKILPGYGGSNAQQPIKLVSPKTQFEFSIGGLDVRITNVTIIIVVAALVLAATADVLINRTRLGRGIRAVAQDPDTATLMGVSRERVIMLTFLIGGLLAGAAALLYTLKNPQGIIYSGGFLLGIKAFSAAVLGGIGNLRGALLGGLLLGVIESYGQQLFGVQWRDVVAFVLLVAVLFFRPTGILGESLGKARA
ncbi:branched-chain amino acid transport system / permease component family protein [Mycolicibacterium hassiacum DSM 44199]|jgi:branched-chain amino acid transport system permease protein|uniref:Branched-chain amino acid transport system / permease component family protein n=1 Tax=Mycolicibacterium hassiacum (strain DSM 44199 / CIP 105218 / JCM 12690 / 3849) TaxID=1122247 RepID=K5BBC2_MYCHD|nr:branched-chain amino acid ABC transporter permease [Mycolicibacterium hassiacum]EKF23735.1 branched-chain amino acid transport system / permease component family protein [Mycolicibacterium hassiacum DSM 44199]MDA4085947.1 branched-chain amino acid ABC transporter permease [Mycolicibacterium hassiacum DSM 44199]PZN24312.1 MAG: branched-chain amino acid ABC transporter permease [Mycolicibacterium hassiacum]VCT90314.1 High-affinity branched-chain amino acid transport system permease protein Liv